MCIIIISIQISKIIWSDNDKKIVAYNKDGAIKTFDVKTAQILGTIAPYMGTDRTDLAVKNDINEIFVIAMDGTLKSLKNLEVSYDWNQISTTCFSKHLKFMPTRV